MQTQALKNMNAEILNKTSGINLFIFLYKYIKIIKAGDKICTLKNNKISKTEIKSA